MKKMIIKNNKKEKAITLIALVITIIVLLILAGVTINTLIGENGILNQSKTASEKYTKAQVKEEIELAIADIQAELMSNSQKVASTYEVKIADSKEPFDMDAVIKYLPNKLEIEATELWVNTNTDEPEGNYKGYEFIVRTSFRVDIIQISNLNENIEEKQRLVLMENFEENYGEIVNSDKIVTNEIKFGNASLYLNSTAITNTGDYGLVADFTIDYWMKEASENLLGQWVPIITVQNDGGMWIGLNSGKFIVRGWNITNYLVLDPPKMDEWVHIAITRKDGIIYVYYDGILQGQVSNTSVFSNGTFCIGSDGTNYTQNSYIDELRISNNTSKWVSNFDVPTDEYNSFEDIIYHFNSDLLEEKTATFSENDKKFGNKSAFFSNNSIKYKDSLNYKLIADFTIDYWIKESNEDVSSTYAPYLVSQKVGGIWLGLISGKFVVRGYNLENYITIEPPKLNEWVHIAVTRKDGIIYVFYNGILQSQIENTNEFENGRLLLGTDGVYYLNNAYIDEIRILNGYCEWTENFSVPTKGYNY